MKLSFPCGFLIGPLIWFVFLAGVAPVIAAENVESIETFEKARMGGRHSEAIQHWRWSPQEKDAAKEFSRVEILESESAEGANGRCLKVSVLKPLPSVTSFCRLWQTEFDYLPPDTTAVRMRVRVLSGKLTLTVGSATTYFANSDVWARPQVLEPGDWRTIEFSLVSDLQRNFRRAVFSAESPVIHYTRWIQEPLDVMLGADSQGELLIDDIELVRSGEGSGYPEFDPAKIHPVASADLARAFTFATDDKEFNLARTPGKEALRKPAVLRPPAAAGEPLEATQRGLEEMSFIGVPISCPEGANALRVTMKAAHQGRFADLVVDFLAMVAPGGVFPWSKQAAQGEKAGFDFCLSPASTKGIPWGFYHARRLVPNGQEVTLVIPFSDFVCAYGSGELRERHQAQQPLRPGEVVAVALVSPFRQGSAETFFTIKSIEAVKLEN